MRKFFFRVDTLIDTKFFCVGYMFENLNYQKRKFEMWTCLAS